MYLYILLHGRRWWDQLGIDKPHYKDHKKTRQKIHVGIFLEFGELRTYMECILTYLLYVYFENLDDIYRNKSFNFFYSLKISVRL